MSNNKEKAMVLAGFVAAPVLLCLFAVALLPMLCMRKLAEPTYCDGCKQFSRGPVCPRC